MLYRLQVLVCTLFADVQACQCCLLACHGKHATTRCCWHCGKAVLGEAFRGADNCMMYAPVILHCLLYAGMPVLSSGVSWDARHSQLLLALRQSGGKAVLRGALKGADKPVMPQAGGAAPRGTCQLKVLVRELDAIEEHSVQVCE